MKQGRGDGTTEEVGEQSSWCAAFVRGAPANVLLMLFCPCATAPLGSRPSCELSAFAEKVAGEHQLPPQSGHEEWPFHTGHQDMLEVLALWER